MNIAITMSGVSRYPKKSYLNLKNQIITPLQDKGCNVKVFIHTWDTKTVVDQKWGYNDSSEKRNYENDFKLSKEWYKKNKELGQTKNSAKLVLFVFGIGPIIGIIIFLYSKGFFNSPNM